METAGCPIRPIRILAIFLALIVSCSTPQEKTDEAPPQSITGKELPSAGCYRYAGNADTILLQLDGKEDPVTGTLVYKLSGKDRNTGTIRGSLKDGLLIANYTFQSEGMQSVRQVAFKWEDGGFVEGYGEIGMRNDTAYFKNKSALSFNPSIRLVAADCK